jgi:hypothetical protein
MACRRAADDADHAGDRGMNNTQKKKKSDAPTKPWPALQQLIDNNGSFSVGYVEPIPCAAVASDAHNMLAALVQRRGEKLTDLLDRLDGAVAKAYDDDIYTDEINAR